MADLTIKQLAMLTGRHEGTLRKLARQGEIPGVYRLGGTWLISPEAADRLRQIPPEDVSTPGRNHD